MITEKVINSNTKRGKDLFRGRKEQTIMGFNLLRHILT
jgi:hypothetical protein